MGRLGHIALLAVSLGVFLAAFVLDVDRVGVYLFGLKWHMHCLLHSLFNIKCAFCGLTRSFAYAAHGRFGEAFEMHLLWPIIFAAIALEIPYRIYRLLGTALLRRSVIRIHSMIWVVTLTVMFAAWIVYLVRLAL